MKDKPFDISQFFSGHLAKLRIEAAYFSDHIDHNAEKGRLNESHFVAMLRRYLPQRFGIGTGFIASTNPKQHRSPQCDIIIYDAVNNIPLYTSPAFSVFPIEMVYGVIEIKTNLDAAELADSLKKCATIRCMAKQYLDDDESLEPEPLHAFRYYDDKQHRWVDLFKSYIRGRLVNGKAEKSVFFNPLAPRFFIFAYRGWQNAKTLSENFKAATLACPDAHVHGLCQLNNNGGFYTRHTPDRAPEDRVDFIQEKSGLSELVLTLPWFLDSMLPFSPDRLGNGFDLIDLTRYDALRSALPAPENYVASGNQHPEPNSIS